MFLILPACYEGQLKQFLDIDQCFGSASVLYGSGSYLETKCGSGFGVPDPDSCLDKIE
jgi:hypothetical protein